MKNNTKLVLLGVIPARGGSKGLKNKNILNVLNKPLISYTIEQASYHKNIYKTIVSTDSKKIAEIAKKNKAEVPFIRPKELARDNSAMLDVLKHALQTCEKLYSIKISGIVLFDPTSPVRKKEDIDKMIDIFIKKKPDLVLAVTKCKRNPYFNMVKINNDNFAQLAARGNFIRRQDTPVVYDIANNCWIFSRRAVINGWRLPKKTIPFEVDSYIDIDTEKDLKLFEWTLKTKRSKKN